MLSGQQIRNISDVAAYRAAEEGKVPLAIEQAGDIRHMPFLGHYVPAGYRVATFADFDAGIGFGFYRPFNSEEVWVECGGFGNDPTGPVLRAGQYWAIVESGQFQTYARCYIKDGDAPAVNLPDEKSVTCEVCGVVHNDLEECEDDEGDCQCAECTGCDDQDMGPDEDGFVF